MPNERLTEALIREHFRNDPLYSSIKFEEQKSTNIRVSKCLESASKSLSGKVGYPEFIITFPAQSMEYILVVECKASITCHESETLDKPMHYAVDGALHYSKFLAKEFNVISIAASGETVGDFTVSQFIQHKNATDIQRMPDRKLLCVFDYANTFHNEQFAYNLKDVNIVEKAVYLNNDFQSCSIAEDARNILVSAILLALQDIVFKTTYKISATSQDVADAMIQAVERVLKKAKVRRISEMLNVYKNIYNEPLVKEDELKQKSGMVSSLEFFQNTISFLETQIFPLLNYDESGYDILGRFYTEFIRYAASKQKQGLVLTPSHITDLFCNLAGLGMNDTVYDCCCGTGGFLIAAMKHMWKLAGNETEKKNFIKENQLVGVEIRPEMFAVACSNMMLRGDGKSNIYRGNSFSKSITEQVKKFKPTVGFLNPPYDLGVADQLKFVEKTLELVAPRDGRVVAVVQMSCGIKDEKEVNIIRKRLLEKYTLKAVISLPDDLFYPVGVITCAMVFVAVPPSKNHKTWFGTLKNDGFVKRKNKGRIDVFDRWKEVRSTFLDAYTNMDEVAGLSVKHNVDYVREKFENEWCWEAYTDTDYSVLNVDSFHTTILKYAAHNVSKGNLAIFKDFSQKTADVPHLNTATWKPFRYDAIFNICKGYYNKKPEHFSVGEIPFIGATESNNGVTERYNIEDISLYHKDGTTNDDPLDKKIFKGNSITVSNNGSVGYAFYQNMEFTCSHDINPLYLKNHQLNVYIAMFLITLIELEQFRWCYGRKWRPKRMPSSIIKLPVQADGSPDYEYMEKFIKNIRL